MRHIHCQNPNFISAVLLTCIACSPHFDHRTESSCQKFCASRQRCEYYTWFSEREERFKFYCFLYSKCEIQVSPVQFRRSNRLRHFRMQIVLAVSLVQLLVGQMQRTGTFGQQQQQQQLQPPQQPTQHALLYQQPQQHDLQHSLEGSVVWEG